MSQGNRCTSMAARIPADGKRGSQLAGVEYPTPAGTDAVRCLWRVVFNNQDNRRLFQRTHSSCYPAPPMPRGNRGSFPGECTKMYLGTSRNTVANSHFESGPLQDSVGPSRVEPWRVPGPARVKFLADLFKLTQGALSARARREPSTMRSAANRDATLQMTQGPGLLEFAKVPAHE
jgi:hypothetical protein